MKFVSSSRSALYSPIEQGARSCSSYGIADAGVLSIQCLDTEAGLIGCILVHPGIYPTIQHMITAEHFVEPVHRAIWEAVSNVAAAGDTPNLLKVKHAL